MQFFKAEWLTAVYPISQALLVYLRILFAMAPTVGNSVDQCRSGGGELRNGLR